MSLRPELRGSGRFFSRILAAFSAGRRTSLSVKSQAAVRVTGVSSMTEPPLPEESIFDAGARIQVSGRACGVPGPSLLPKPGPACRGRGPAARP